MTTSIDTDRRQVQDVEPKQKPLLEIENLHVEFRARHGVAKVLNGVNLDILEGETLGVVGESGCGKSVTAQAILRVIPKPGKITHGKINIQRSAPGNTSGTVDIASLQERDPIIKDIRRQDISIIFQEPMTALSPVHTIGNQIIEKIRIASKISARDARHQAIDMLSRVGIPGAEKRIDAYTFELSGGMRQRAMIAMALVNRPRLVIADEPTTAVDVTIQAQILRLLKGLQQEFGMSIMMITHDMGVVAALADRVAIMYRGQVVERGLVRDIFKNPKHPYTQGLLSAIPTLSTRPDERLGTIEGVVPHPFAYVPGCDFHPRCKAFMPGLCDREAPKEVSIGQGHSVSCFLYGGNGHE